MNLDRRILLVAAALLLIPTGRARAQVQGQLNPGQAFATMKPGQWIRLEGALQNQGVSCNQVKLLSGAFKDSAASVRAALRGIDPTTHQLTVGPYRVRLIEHPKYGSPSGTLEFSDLRPGMFVKVEGVYGKDGIFVARKLDDESDQLAKKPELRGRVRVQGRIERTDPSKRTIIMMGTRFIVAPNAQIRSVAKSAPEP